MDVLHARCCGLDVHKSSISACILLREAGRVQKHQRRFGAMTQDLQELAEWLRQFGVTQVAPTVLILRNFYPQTYTQETDSCDSLQRLASPAENVSR